MANLPPSHLKTVFFPMPNAQGTPDAWVGKPKAQHWRNNAQCPMPNALFPNQLTR
ncbi:MAG: hypothetical protein ACHBN1_37110 [Heteroscytonema crispum UTEX LB 1556]